MLVSHRPALASSPPSSRRSSPLSSAEGEQVALPTDSVCQGDEGKTAWQHVGFATFGAASAASVAGSVSKLARVPAVARQVPGLNAGVAVVEAYNTTQQLMAGKYVDAAGHAGNALGCLAAAGEDIGRVAALVGAGHPGASHVASLGRVLGLAGGVVGVAQASFELAEARRLRERSPEAADRKQVLGALGLASGATTVGGILLSGLRGVPGLGIALLTTASVCDLVSIHFEYKKVSDKHPSASPERGAPCPPTRA